MFLRKNTVRKKSGVYVYSQIVESFRRPKDGMPATRVLANLGQVDEIQFTNLQRAFEASKSGKAVVISDSICEPAILCKPRANLSYLDVAVLLELWRTWQLDKVFTELTAKSEASVGLEKVIAALAIHRCVDPDSKLSATKWFSRTALPELLQVHGSSFNNSRIHRALENLERITAPLMARLPILYQKDSPVFSSLFLDVSDTWFVGDGPELAALGKTKEGLLKKKVGIVLLVNEDGFPLRWETVSGSASDCNLMTSMLESIKNLSWLGSAPLVCDRAMGKTAQIANMYRMNINFLTAITKTEFSTYAPDLITISVGENASDNTSELDIVSQARAMARKLPLKEIDKDLFVVDYGCTERIVRSKSNLTFEGSDDSDPVRRAMRLCKEIGQLVADKRFSSQTAAGASLGISKALTWRYLQLRLLPLDIQNAIIDGTIYAASIDDLLRISKLKSSEEMIEKFKEISQGKIKPSSRHLRPDQKSRIEEVNLKVRIVAYFNPVMFAEKQMKSQRLLGRVKSFEIDLNSRLSSHGSRRSREKIASEIDRFLSRDNYLGIFTVEISEVNFEDKKTFRVALHLNQEEWSKRRRYDGYCVLACHPNLQLSAERICQLYREKNMVEIDFRTIKGTFEIRPMYHHTDQKVSAHVTICMLSLLLERTLRKKMGNHGSAQKALDTLEACNLNHYVLDTQSLYSTTCADPEQEKILHHLNMNYLIDDVLIAEKIMPRT